MTIGYVGYFQTEKGYIYHISKVGGSNDVAIVGSSSTPANNVEYDVISSLATGTTYDYISNSNDTLFISMNTNYNATTISITREKLENFDGAVAGLVENVGVNQLWGVFESGIDFVGVIVLVAFGLFLIFLLIKKLSKGKSDF